MLEELKGARVGIEAAHYLDHRLLNRPRVSEPLVPALGGLPLGFWQHIEEDLNRFAQLEIELFFVFSGLDITRQEDPFQARQAAAAVNLDAWRLYDSHKAEESVQRFGESRTSASIHAPTVAANCAQHMSRQRTFSEHSSPS